MREKTTTQPLVYSDTHICGDINMHVHLHKEIRTYPWVLRAHTDSDTYIYANKGIFSTKEIHYLCFILTLSQQR